MQTEKKHIAILYGGRSGEHEVSCRSAASVYTHIDRDRYRISLIGIDRRGVWHLQERAVFNEDRSVLEIYEHKGDLVCASPGIGLVQQEKNLAVDIVFPVLHGSFGEDGTVQGLLEICSLPYVGAGVLGSSLCMDKAAAKRIWLQAGLPVVPFEELQIGSWQEKRMQATAVLEGSKRFGFPLFIKPSRTGSSVGVSCCQDHKALERALEDAFRFDSKVLIEPSVDGREIECSVMGNQDLQSFAPGEIVPNHGFYDYEAKYLDPSGAALIIPAELKRETSHTIRTYAEEAYRVADVEGFARVDFFLERDSGKIYLNEINTLPGFTSISMFPKLCEAGGVPYTELITILINNAEKRFETAEMRNYQWS